MKNQTKKQMAGFFLPALFSSGRLDTNNSSGQGDSSGRCGMFDQSSGTKTLALALVFGLFATPALAIGGAAAEISPFVYLFSIFVMAIFVGYYVVWSVTPALHTPLMAVTNAISSVIVVGALLAVGLSSLAGSWAAGLFGFGALVMAAINIVGGFLVTQRMLAMYKKKDR